MLSQWDIGTYVPKRKSVRAVRLDADNSHDVAQWCGARVRQLGNPGFSSACLDLPNGQIAQSGDWITVTEDRWTVLHDAVFISTFEEV
jgi:hypothetical protein